MKRLSRITAIIAASVLTININCFGQVYGKLFTSKVANQKYGAVVESVKFSVQDFQKLLKETDKYIMFKMVNNSIIILDQDRKVLYPEDVTIKPEEVFSVYSKSVVEDLISVGDAESVFFEQRNEVFTITVGNVTMELSTLCPPYCSGQ